VMAWTCPKLDIKPAQRRQRAGISHSRNPFSWGHGARPLAFYF
jgi:hypothetical protein